tara:strand:+ start:51 stop:260 length:210 start_codon:yes stop_codon:yes gene_type:complete
MSSLCDNCKGYIPGFYNENNIFIPDAYTTIWGGKLCSSGCGLRYIYKNQKIIKIQSWYKKKLKKEYLND